MSAADAPPVAPARHVLDLPLDRPRRAGQGTDMRRTARTLDPALLAAMRTASEHAGFDLFDGLLAAFVATLYRLSGQDDIAVGIPKKEAQTDEWLTLHVAPQAAQRFDALMSECHAGVQARSPQQRMLTSVCFAFDRSAAESDEPFDLSLVLRPHQDENGALHAEARYNADLFDEASVQRWLEMFACVVRSAAANPAELVGRLDVLSPEAARELAALQPPPTALVGEPFAHAGFIAYAARHPAHIAVRNGERVCSYGELDALSNRLAHALRARGVGRGQRVGLCLERSADMFVALLAVLKSGAAYVPLDPSFPQARLDYYAQDAGFSLLLTASGVASAPRTWCEGAAARVFEIDRDTAWHQAPADALPPGGQDARPDDAAYVIYTSGSTGKPKGVCVPHRAVANLLQSMQREPGIGPRDRIAAVTTLSFDMAVPEVLLPLAAGAQIVLVQRETAMDGQRLRALLEAQRITILQATPGMWQLLLEAQWQGRKESDAGPGLRGWIGAEPVRAHLALALLDRCTALWNLYGPTETTVWSTAWHMQRDAVAARGVAIGKPIDNTGVWILDAQLQPCPVGVAGEICIGGDGMTLGYLERAGLTAERFVNVRILGTDTPVYRTGDRGRWRNDGLLEHLGRLDFQVKVRGYRIEPGEIEARCNEHAGVSRSVVVAREDHPGDVRLVAYLALVPGTALDRRALTQHLRERLPSYMLPQHVVTLAALPTLPNGKIDRGALPAPHSVQAAQVEQPPMPAAARPPLVVRPDRRTAPLTPAQARIHHEETLHPGRAFHNMPFAQRLQGALDVARFEEVLRAIVRRQPALRTCIGADPQGQAMQSMAPHVDFALPTIDLRGLPADQREAELADRMQELADRPIDIRTAPMAHAALFQLDEEDHAFVFVPHRLVWDDGSFELLQRELAALYVQSSLSSEALPALASTHGDHAEWLADWMQAPDFDAQLGFWRQRAAPASLPLPRTDMPRPTGRSGQGGVQPIDIDPAATRRLHDTAHGLGTTLDVLALALYALTLGQVTGRETVAIAAPVRGRQQPEAHHVMGPFDTVVPVRLALDMQASLPQFVQRVQQELLALADHQHAPFEQFVAPCPWSFSFIDAREHPAQLADLHTRRIPLAQRGATEDIALRLVEGARGLEGALACNSGIYLRETGARLRERYLELLHRAAYRPEATLAYIASTEGSASAAWLQKLSAADASARREATAVAETVSPTLPVTAHLANAEQARLAEVWAGVIRIEVRDIRANDNFFELGGDSLLAQRAVQQTEKLLGYRVEPQRYLYETLGQIAASATGAAADGELRGASQDMTDEQEMPDIAMATGARSPGLLGRAFGGWRRKG
ncbi:amino acid adenylation domain-containing protein [Variovorax sp. J22G73]|uniref:amino acid adenylation domain-containing protein n=1 Tax=unclassified Variovorax TaxID=663243 RepID=UPI002574F3EC|nr:MULTISPECIES: amino acid adenylation domain-containing protein [unclassified Variovorax]MDM0005389.1 amino acid adenylation domain-containing protein [Variovorax sp. J22R203]MDM0098805.1 amino acid adenylation domain-containing protein [Variovorax sp. J22G73]